MRNGERDRSLSADNVSTESTSRIVSRIRSARIRLTSISPGDVALILIASGLVASVCFSIFSSLGPFYWYDSLNHFYAMDLYRRDGPLLHYTMSSPVTGSFYPLFAMYGGSLYAGTGTAANLVGSSWLAYALSYLAAFACAIVGVTWLAMTLGTRRPHAVAVGVLYVSSSYYL